MVIICLSSSWTSGGDWELWSRQMWPGKAPEIPMLLWNGMSKNKMVRSPRLGPEFKYQSSLVFEPWSDQGSLNQQLDVSQSVYDTFWSLHWHTDTMRPTSHSKSVTVKEDTRPPAEGLTLVSAPYAAAKGTGQAGDSDITLSSPARLQGQSMTGSGQVACLPFSDTSRTPRDL